MEHYKKGFDAASETTRTPARIEMAMSGEDYNAKYCTDCYVHDELVVGVEHEPGVNSIVSLSGMEKALSDFEVEMPQELYGRLIEAISHGTRTIGIKKV